MKMYYFLLKRKQLQKRILVGGCWLVLPSDFQTQGKYDRQDATGKGRDSWHQPDTVQAKDGRE